MGVTRRNPDEIRQVPEREIEYEPIPGKTPQEWQEELESPESPDGVPDEVAHTSKVSPAAPIPHGDNRQDDGSPSNTQ
jgi:hypothetical protein